MNDNALNLVKPNKGDVNWDEIMNENLDKIQSHINNNNNNSSKPYIIGETLVYPGANAFIVGDTLVLS